MREAAKTLLAAALVVLAYLVVTSGPVERFLFDPAHAHEFYVTKGVVGVAAVALYIAHMSAVWAGLKNNAQRLRYVCLLYGAVLVTSASAEQVKQEAEVNWRNVGGLGFILLLLLTVVVSMLKDQGRYQSTV